MCLTSKKARNSTNKIENVSYKLKSSSRSFLLLVKVYFKTCCALLNIVQYIIICFVGRNQILTTPCIGNQVANTIITDDRWLLFQSKLFLKMWLFIVNINLKKVKNKNTKSNNKWKSHIIYVDCTQSIRDTQKWQRWFWAISCCFV